MEEWYQEHRKYAASLVQTLQRQLDLLSCLDETVSEQYEKYANIIDSIDFELTCEIDEWQEDEDLPTKEKIDALLVELLLENKTKNPYTVKSKKLSFADILDTWRKREQN